jgi:hypothetical protein
MPPSRSRTAALVAGVAGAGTGIAWGLFKFAAPALLTAAEDAARTTVARLLSVAPAPAPLEHEWTSMLRRLPPQAQEAVYVRRTVELAVSTGRPACRHVKKGGDDVGPGDDLTWCMCHALPTCKPSSCVSETVAGLAAALQGKAPPPPTPRRGTVPANYSGARPPRAPVRWRAGGVCVASRPAAAKAA